MSSLFERLRDKTGLTLLTKYGDTFRITKNSGTFSASTGSYTVATTTQTVVGKSFSRGEESAEPELVETAESDIFISASGITFNPARGMGIVEVNRPETPMTIVEVERIPESGVAVIFRVKARR
jgi:hypothetical protein